MYQSVSELEHLAAVNDQITKTASCADKFTDHDTYQAQPDIDFKRTEQERHGRRQDHLEQGILFRPSQSIDQLDGIRIHFLETAVQVDDGTEDRHRHSGNDNGAHIGAQPDDQKRCHCRFRQAVQHDEIWLHNGGKTGTEPQDHGDSDPKQDHKEKADECLGEGDPDMSEKSLVTAHGPEGFRYAGRTGKDEGIDPSKGGSRLPEDQKGGKQKNLSNVNLYFSLPLFFEKAFLCGQRLVSFHSYSAPSRFD